MLLTGVGGGGATGYQGPGDVVSGALIWGSTARAYNAAYATGSNPAMTLVDQAGANSITINILSTGFVDIASINAWVTANSVTTIKVTKIFDQTGNTAGWSNATLSTMPTLTLNAQNGLPGFTSTSAANTLLAMTAGITFSPPATYVAVGKRTTNFTNQQAMIGFTTSPNVVLGFQNIASTVYFTTGSGSATLGSVTDGNFHALQGYVDTVSANGFVAADGVNGTTASIGIFSPSSNLMRLCRASGGISLDGTMLEAGVWPSNTTGTGLNANIHSASNGYNF